MIKYYTELNDLHNGDTVLLDFRGNEFGVHEVLYVQTQGKNLGCLLMNNDGHTAYWVWGMGSQFRKVDPDAVEIKIMRRPVGDIIETVASSAY